MDYDARIGGMNWFLKVAKGMSHSVLHFLGCHNLEVLAFLHWNQDVLYVSVLASWRSYELQIALGVVNLLLWSYLSDLYCGGTELERTMVTRIAEI